MFGLSPSETKLALTCLVLGLGIFLLDLLLPLGVAAGLPYIAVVAVSLGSLRRGFIFSVAGICTALTVLGYVLSSGESSWMVLTNRVLAVLAIWITVGLILKHRKTGISAQSYSDLFNSIQTGLYIYRLEDLSDERSLRLIAANPASARLTGVPVQKLMNNTLHENFPDLGRTSVPGIFAEVVRTGVSKAVEDFHYGDDRVVRAVWSFKAFPMPDQCLAVGFEDITLRKEAEKNLRDTQRRLSGLMASLPGMVYRCRNDEDWTVEFANEGCLDLTGHSPSVFMSGEVSYGRDLIHPDDQEQVWDNVQAALRKKQAFELTYRIRTSNQTEKWVWEQGHGVFSDEGELIALEGFITDISEKRRAEELLTESQERLKAQYRGFPVPTSSWKRVMGGRFILVDYNEAMEETLGHTIKELLGREAGELYGSRPDILENFEACLSSRETIRREVEFRYPSGESARNLSMTFVFVPPDLVMVHAEDITERKWAETELNRSNNVFKLLAGYNEQISGLGVEAAARKTLELIREQLGYPDCSVALWESGRGGFRTLRGPGGEGGGGREEAFIPSEKTVLSEMVGTPDPRYRPDIEAENPSTAMDQLLLSAGIRSDFIVPLWGGHRFLGTLNVGSGRVNGFSSTDRYHLTLIGPRLSQAIHNASLIKKLEKSQESLSEAQRVARIGNWDWNIKSNELKWSDEIYRIFGLDPQTFGATYEAFLEAVHPEDRDAVKAAVHEALFEKKTYNIDHRIVLRNGTQRVVHEQAEVTFDEIGDPVRMIGTVQDITERKKAEAAIQESERRFRELGELLPEAVFETDENGMFRYVNRKMSEFFGIIPGNFKKGINLVEIISSREAYRARDDIRTVMAGGHISFSEFKARKKDGTEFPAAWHLAAIYRNDKPIGIRGVILDMTIFKRNEMELIKAQKLESLGVLAGGIAHDFKNILTAIMGNLSLAEKGARGKAVKAAIKRAESAAGRAKGLTNQLLTFSKGGHPVKQSASARELIGEAVSIGLSGSNVTPVFSIPESLHDVEADPDQIIQALSNLVINSVQAMPSGGNVWIEAQNRVGMPSEGGSPDSGPFVEISLRDEGVGIPQGNINRIFDPYFSTREGKTGLGLSMAYSIIKKHDGRLEVESVEGEGATFRVILPAIQKQGVSRNVKLQKKPGGKKRILFLDDEPDIRTFVGLLLRQKGYSVDCVESGEEAVVRYKNAFKKGEPYHMAVLDLTVRGGLGGRETLEILRRIDPGVRAVVCSGYSQDPIMSDPAQYGFVGVIQKPFAAEELVLILEKNLKEERKNLKKESGS